MTEDEFIEEHIEPVSDWVYSCARYALRNFTHEIDGEVIHGEREVISEFKDENGTFFTDLRLQYRNGDIITHSGSSDYDQDHRGYWSSGSVEWCAEYDTCEDIAKYMLTDLFNEIPEGEENGNQ